MPFEPLSLVSPEAVERLHGASLHILARVGVEVRHEEARRLLGGVGAEVHDDSPMVHLPEAVVEHALAVAGKGHTLCGRARERTAPFGGGAANFLSTAGQAHWVDMIAGTRRPATLADAQTGIRLGDALPHIGIVGAMATPSDLPVASREVRLVAELLQGTTKPIACWVTSGPAAQYVVRLLEAVTGGADELRRYPPMEGFYEAVSPLRLASAGMDALFELTRAGLPIGLGPMAMACATAPATLAGTVAQENAEILASLVLVQATRPGTCVTYWGIPHVMDPATGLCSFGSPEQGLMAAVMAQLARRYGLPCGLNVALADSCTADAQAGVEKATGLMLGLLAGADVFGHQGIAGADQGASLDQLVVDDELAGMARRIHRGLAVDEEAIALEVIERVGPGGHYLTDPHTAAHFRQELWFPTLFARRRWDDWVTSGQRTALQAARERSDHLLATHEPEPMAEDLRRELEAIVADAERSLS